MKRHIGNPNSLDSLWLIGLVAAALLVSGAGAGVWVAFVGAAAVLLAAETIYDRTAARLAAHQARRSAESRRATSRAKRAATATYGPSMLPAVRSKRRRR